MPEYPSSTVEYRRVPQRTPRALRMLTALWFTILPRAFASALTTRASRTRQLPHAAAPARPWRVRPSASPRGITQLRAHGVHRRGSTGYPPRTGVLTPGCFRQTRLCAAGTLRGLQVAATRHLRCAQCAHAGDVSPQTLGYSHRGASVRPQCGPSHCAQCAHAGDVSGPSRLRLPLNTVFVCDSPSKPSVGLRGV